MDTIMRDVRITVVKTANHDDLIQKYGTNGDVGPCPFHREGQVMLAKCGGKPAEICEEAWTAIGKYCFALAMGVDGFWEEWIDTRYMSVNSCNDGLRPVSFLLQALDENGVPLSETYKK